MVDIAVDLCHAIDKAIQADQGAAYRGWLGKVLPHMSDAYRDTEESGPHQQMGVLNPPGDCTRRNGYSFHWAAWRQHIADACPADLIAAILRKPVSLRCSTPVCSSINKTQKGNSFVFTLAMGMAEDLETALHIIIMPQL